MAFGQDGGTSPSAAATTQNEEWKISHGLPAASGGWKSSASTSSPCGPCVYVHSVPPSQGSQSVDRLLRPGFADEPRASKSDATAATQPEQYET